MVGHTDIADEPLHSLVSSPPLVRVRLMQARVKPCFTPPPLLPKGRQLAPKDTFHLREMGWAYL